LKDNYQAGISASERTTALLGAYIAHYSALAIPRAPSPQGIYPVLALVIVLPDVRPLLKLAQDQLEVRVVGLHGHAEIPVELDQGLECDVCLHTGKRCTQAVVAALSKPRSNDIEDPGSLEHRRVVVDASSNGTTVAALMTP
jgi:hypothetical protein